MKHVSDQELLLHAHRSLGFIRSVFAGNHLRFCATCRKRYASLSSLSVATASAIRIGMPAWKPVGLTAAIKTLIAMGVLAAGVFCTEVVAANRTPSNPTPVTGVANRTPNACKTITPPVSEPTTPAAPQNTRPTLQRVKDPN